MRHARAPRRLFDDILQLLQANRASRAVEQCREALEEFPDDVNILGLLGAALGDLRYFDEAEEVLRRTVDLAPTFAKPHEDLGMLLVQQSRAEEALPLLEKAVRLDPTLEEAHFQHGRALAMLGRGDEADAAFERCFALSPVRRAMALAAEHHREGRLPEAEKLCRRVLQQEPRHVDALRMLGLIAATSGEFEDAEYLLRQVLETAPDHAAAMFELGRVLGEMDRHEEAIDIYQRLLNLEPDNPKVHYRIAGARAAAALTGAAAASYRRCLALAPGHAGAWLGLGHMLKTLGDQSGGIEAYRRCLELQPDFGEAFWSLANLKTYHFAETEIAVMRERLDSGDPGETSRINFLFALAKAFEDRGDYQRAWRYYTEGNARQRQQVYYDPVQTEVLNDQLTAFFTADFFEAVRGVGCADAAPIFIVGLPRSGSTLIEQIISSHSQVEGTGELPYIGRLTHSLNRNRADGLQYPAVLAELEPRHFERLGREYLALADRHRLDGAPLFIDKMPNNFPGIGFIHCILPRARIIDARRHPLDACVANLRQLYARGQTFSYDQSDIGEYCLQYHRMMDHWDTVLPGRVLHVRYEDIVDDLETQVGRMLDFLQLPREDACLRFYDTERAVRTASSEQVRRPIYTSGVGFWRHYAPYLDELIEILQPLLDERELHREQRMQ